MSKVIKASQIIGKYELFKKERAGDYLKGNTVSEKESPLNKIQNSEENLNNKKEEILTEARKQANQIIEEAEEEKQLVEKIKKEAYKTGFHQGKEEGLQEAKKDIEAFKKALEQFNAQIQQRKEKLKLQIIKLSAKIASIVVHSNLNINPDLINNIIEDLLDDIGENHQNILIKVHPEMFHYIDKNRFEEDFFKGNLKFAVDNTLKKGDCIVESNFGGKDAIIDNKLQLLEEKLYKEAGLHEEV